MKNGVLQSCNNLGSIRCAAKVFIRWFDKFYNYCAININSNQWRWYRINFEDGPNIVKKFNQRWCWEQPKNWSYSRKKHAQHSDFAKVPVKNAIIRSTVSLDIQGIDYGPASSPDRLWWEAELRQRHSNWVSKLNVVSKKSYKSRERAKKTERLRKKTDKYQPVYVRQLWSPKRIH